MFPSCFIVVAMVIAVANKWILVYGNTFRRPCGASPDSRQLDVEKIVTPGSLT